MQKMFPKEYAFYPKAWCLPAEYVFSMFDQRKMFVKCICFSFDSSRFENSYSDFAKYCAERKGKTFISKPDVGCQGRGIFITKNPSKDIKP